MYLTLLKEARQGTWCPASKNRGYEKSFSSNALTPPCHRRASYPALIEWKCWLLLVAWSNDAPGSSGYAWSVPIGPLGPCGYHFPLTPPNTSKSSREIRKSKSEITFPQCIEDPLVTGPWLIWGHAPTDHCWFQLWISYVPMWFRLACTGAIVLDPAVQLLLVVRHACFQTTFHLQIWTDSYAPEGRGLFPIGQKRRLEDKDLVIGGHVQWTYWLSIECFKD